MKTYRISYSMSGVIYVDADSESEAEQEFDELFANGSLYYEIDDYDIAEGGDEDDD